MSEDKGKYVYVGCQELADIVCEKLRTLGYEIAGSKNLKLEGRYDCIFFNARDGMVRKGRFEDVFGRRKETDITYIFTELTSYKKPEPEKMLSVGGKEYSESTIKKALSEYVQ